MFNFLSSLRRTTPSPNPTDVVQAVAAKQAIVIDVREEAETRAGHAEGALLLPLSRLHLTADPSSADFDTRLAAARTAGLPIYVYCASGARSGRAVGVLQGFGFATVQNLGHLGSWQQGGGQVLR